MTQAVSGCGGGSSRDRIHLTRLMWRKLSQLTGSDTPTRFMWRKLSLQDHHYHVPDRQDLFCTVNQLNKVVQQAMGLPDMGLPDDIEAGPD